VPFLAASGAAIILWGHWWEKYEKREQFVDVKDLWKSKRRAHWGRIIVLLGVSWECAIGFGLAAYDGWQLNPWNGTISDISADMYFEVDATNRPNSELQIDLEYPDGTLIFCNILPKPTDKNISPKFFPLYADRLTCGFPPTTNELRNISYGAYFHNEGEGAFSSNFTNISVKMISQIKFSWIQLNHIPENTKILGGTVEVKVDGTRGSVKRLFRIYPQISLVRNGIAEITATNTQIE
jgi:hypothetical protein